MKPSRTIKFQCKTCGKEVETYYSVANRGRKFCSNECYYESLRVRRLEVLPETKRCSRCGEEKPLGEFHKCERNKRLGLHAICKDCNIKHAMDYYYSKPKDISRHVSEFAKKDRKACPEKYSKRFKKYLDHLWESALEFFGPCACCGESTREFLSIDHINGHGNDYRRSPRAKSGNSLLKEFNRLGWPEELKKEYRILCMNCNFSIGHFGFCPHHPERKYTYWNPSSRQWEDPE